MLSSRNAFLVSLSSPHRPVGGTHELLQFVKDLFLPGAVTKDSSARHCARGKSIRMLNLPAELENLRTESADVL